MFSHRILSWSLGAPAAVAAALAVGSLAPAAQAQSTTAVAQAAYDDLGAQFDWDLYMDRFLYTGHESSKLPQYDSWHLAWGQSYVMQTEVAMFEATGDAAHLEYLLDNAEAMFAHRSDRVGLACSPKPDPDVMRVFSGPSGQEAFDVRRQEA